MAVSTDYHAYVVDQLSLSMQVASRRMFGGVGLYCDGLFFGLIADDVLYLKADDSNRADYSSRGCAAFQPFADEPKTYSMNYFSVPPEVLEDADELRLWARKSIAIAAVAAAAKSAAAGRTGRRKKTARKPAGNGGRSA